MAPENEDAPHPHLNLNVRGMATSATLAINQRCLELAREGKHVFRLGLGQSPFPVPQPVVEELQTWAWRKEYQDVRGLRPLREAVATFHNSRHGMSATADNVLIGPGSKELMFLLQLAYYGDILIPSPAWVSYAPQAQIVGRRVHWIPTRFKDGWALRPDALDAHCREDRHRPRLLVLNYPNNPTGRTYADEELAELAACARRYRMVVLSDEIYGELHHLGEHRSIAAYYPEGTILSSGLSKWCGAGGWRLGTFTFPQSLDWLFRAMAAIASETYTTTSAPVQWAAVRAFELGPDIERYLGTARRILRALAQSLHARLTGASVEVAAASGAFYLFPRFTAHRERLAGRGITTSPSLCRRLLEQTGIAVLPGSDFGRPRKELSARLAYVDFDGTRAMLEAEDLDPAARLGEAFLQRNCSRVLTAVDRLLEWLEQ